MIIYKRTNTVNGKVYIGQSIRSEQLRWQECIVDSRNGRTSRLCAAIKKYGSFAFVSEVLYRAKTRTELDRMETFFIILHQSHVYEFGYNMTLGGDGDPKKGKSLVEFYGEERAKEIKKKLSE